MKAWLLFLLVLAAVPLTAQEPILAAGSTFPSLVIAPIHNAPVKTFNVQAARDNKFYILNFWGTWCSPCIPEMDSLAKLQVANKGKLQVISISNDDDERIRKFLVKRPSSLWLATDSAYTLYQMLQLNSVGQCILINPAKKIVAVMKTASVNQPLIDRLLRGDPIVSTGEIKEAAVRRDGDLFGVDSLQSFSFTLRGYMKGQRSMMRRWIQDGFDGRRMSWINVSPGGLYRDAYGINNPLQWVYDSSVSSKEVFDFDEKSKLLCLDLLVPAAQKDSLLFVLRRLLPLYLPLKARLEERSMPVYVLKRLDGKPLGITASTASASTFSFSGHGYEGIKVAVADFANIYLANELDLPVKDETGLTGLYDITTKVDMRTQAQVIQSIEALGLTVVKEERMMPVLVYFK